MTGATDLPFVDPAYPSSETTGQIIAAALAVHRTLGPGFEEVFYQRALAMELPGFGLEFAREVWIDVCYKGHILGRKRVDFVIEDVMLEIKARGQLEPVHHVQALSYLKASGYKVGLLINFGAARLEIKRLAN
ncbi:GxxExxY protein [Chloroflexales bacterium ZM16-3]|nr:GxxExxY protein [Chloroflexales bacterium ZM16-3]